MNYLLSLIALMSLASCNVSKTSNSKKCTFNGEPVDCSESSSESDGRDESSESIVLNANVSAAISISNNEIEFLENTLDEAKETKNGNEYECSSETQAGETLNYKLSGNTLGIFARNTVETYTRVSGDAKFIQGSWKSIERDEMGLTTTILVFTENKMQLNVKCEFNN